MSQPSSGNRFTARDIVRVAGLEPFNGYQLFEGDYEDGDRFDTKFYVARVLPPLPAPNPLYDPDGFIAASQRHGERERLYWRTFARLRAKATGEAPYLKLPKDCEHLFGPGTAMFDVSRELLSDAELSDLSRGHRKFQRERRA